MNLQETIRRILREERDRSDLMVKLLNTTIIPQYETICKVEVTAPRNREFSSRFYSVKVFFDGYSKLPGNDDILNEIWILFIAHLE